MKEVEVCGQKGGGAGGMLVVVGEAAEGYLLIEMISVFIPYKSAVSCTQRGCRLLRLISKAKKPPAFLEFQSPPIRMRLLSA